MGTKSILYITGGFILYLIVNGKLHNYIGFLTKGN